MNAALLNVNDNDNLNLNDNANTIKIDTSHHHHTVFEWEGFTVENHYDFLNVHHHKSNVEMERIFKSLGDFKNANDNANDNLNANLKKKAERIVEFILKGGKWRKWRDTMTVAQIFPWNTVKFSPGILLGVTWMKVKERLG